ncbi:MAG: hypothetical protein AAFX76_09740 [Planctomycetota bacterium]
MHADRVDRFGVVVDGDPAELLDGVADEGVVFAELGGLGPRDGVPGGDGAVGVEIADEFAELDQRAEARRW